MTSFASIEGQYAAMASNIGVWEGNLASFGPDGAVTTPKAPTILYVYCDTLDDARKVAAGQVPFKVCPRALRRVTHCVLEASLPVCTILV